METEIEKLQTIKWEMRQKKLQPHQRKFVEKIARFLKENPKALLNVRPMVYDSKEKEWILFFEAKKKYFLFCHPEADGKFTQADSLLVTEMSVKDANLVAHLSKNLRDTSMFTVQEKCLNFVGNEIVNAELKKLDKDRQQMFLNLFLKNGTGNQLKIHTAETCIPYNGFSYFKLDYPTGVPDDLNKAYQKMNRLNDEGPRKKYRDQRKKEAALLRNAEKL